MNNEQWRAGPGFLHFLRNKILSLFSPLVTPLIINDFFKIYIIEVYLLKYYFETHLIYKSRYYRQTIFKQYM